MKEISKEYLKIYRSVIIQLWVIAALCAAAFAVSGAFKGGRVWFAVIVCTAFGVFALTLTLIILIAPRRFEHRLKKGSKEVREEILEGKFAVLGARRFYENHLLYYSRRKINLVRYDEIECVEIKSIMKMELTLKAGNNGKDGEKLVLPTNPDENSAVIAAAFKSKNPRIRFVINGKTIDNIDVKERKK